MSRSGQAIEPTESADEHWLMAFVEVERLGTVARVWLDDPARRNALSLAMVAEIDAIFDELENDDSITAVVLGGRPPAFCAGADLSELAAIDREGLSAIYRGFLRIAGSTLPTVAAVNGAAIGAGVNMALACDLRLAGRSARFDSRFLALGLHPGGGHLWLLERIGGLGLAAAMVLFGEVLDADAARRHGLVWEVVDDELLGDRALELARRAGSYPAPVSARVKASLAALPRIDDHAAAVELELEPQAWSAAREQFAARIERAKKKKLGE